MNNPIRVHGSLFRAFLNAGDSLKLLLKKNVEHLHSYDHGTWYPFDEFDELLGLAKRYKNSNKILEQLGIGMVVSWYHNGPGKAIIKIAEKFLKNIRTWPNSSVGN